MKSPNSLVSQVVSQSGQMTMEAMLLMTVFLMVALSVHKRAISNGWVQTLVEGPWTHVQGMIEDGVWMKAGATSKAMHPSLLSRKGSVDGDKVP